MLLIGKTQEVAREVNAIVSVLNTYALQNGTTGIQTRQQVQFVKMFALHVPFILPAFSVRRLT